MDVRFQQAQVTTTLPHNIVASRKFQRDLRQLEKAELVGRHTYIAAYDVSVFGRAHWNSFIDSTSSEVSGFHFIDPNQGVEDV